MTDNITSDIMKGWRGVAIHFTMITTYGVAAGKHSGIIQRQVTMDDLFAV